MVSKLTKDFEEEHEGRRKEQTYPYVTVGPYVVSALLVIE